MSINYLAKLPEELLTLTQVPQPHASDLTCHLDTTGLICPEPIMMLHSELRRMQSGQIIQVDATDPATTRDIPNLCHHLKHQLLAVDFSGLSDAIASQTDTPVLKYWLQKA